jgi:hypothetical protein
MPGATFTPAVRSLCWERAKGRCEACGATLRPGANLHHRTGRGMGGMRRKVTAADGLFLCGNGNTSGCHRLMDTERQWAIDRGFVVPRNGQHIPAAVPVHHAAYGLVWLLADGGVQPLNEGGEFAWA